MNNNRMIIGLVAIGVGAIIVVAWFIFAGTIATRNYTDTKTSPVVTATAAEQHKAK